MQARRLAAGCAAIALAAVFSVQQGEHGPLVVYKLQLPDQSTPAAAAPVIIPAQTTLTPVVIPASGPLRPTLEDIVVIPSRAPAILGTVVLPAPLPTAAAAEPELPAPAEGTITLQQVSDEIHWRRETLERLPEAPFAPRF